jgi:hypothetical protein
MMDIRSLLTNLPSRAERALYMEAVGTSRKEVTSLLNMIFEEKDPLAWRSAWILDGSDELHPGLVRDRIAWVIQKLTGLSSTGALRSLLRMMCRYDIPEEEQGLLIDLCFGYMVSELYPVAVKVHAMQIIYQHALLYPELKEELQTVIEDQIGNNSVGFKSRGTRILQKLERL